MSRGQPVEDHELYRALANRCTFLTIQNERMEARIAEQERAIAALENDLSQWQGKGYGPCWCGKTEYP